MKKSDLLKIGEKYEKEIAADLTSKT